MGCAIPIHKGSMSCPPSNTKKFVKNPASSSTFTPFPQKKKFKKKHVHHPFTTWNLIPGLGSVVIGSPSFIISHEVRPFGRGPMVPQPPSLGDNKQPKWKRLHHWTIHCDLIIPRLSEKGRRSDRNPVLGSHFLGDVIGFIHQIRRLVNHRLHGYREGGRNKGIMVC